MIYLDYSATTPVRDVAINAISKICNTPGNPNSVHHNGLVLVESINEDREKILHLLGLDPEIYDLIPTSGATEANNLILRGTFERLAPKGFKHIISTELEHSSVNAPISALQKQGASFDFVSLLPDGRVDMENLMELVREDTLMVSIGAINSETGIRQPIEEIGKYLKENHPHVIFHSDATQAIGKIPVDYSDVDAISLSAHKFYCLKGIGALIKKKKLTIIPQNKGGSSTTKFRAGTPCAELIHAMRTSLEDTLCDQDAKMRKVQELNHYLREALCQYPGVLINSPEDAIPHILNISYMGHPANELQAFMSEREIYISTGTACASHSDMSATILKLTEDEERARSSIRLSLSDQTEIAELEAFVKAFEIYSEGGE